MRIIAVTSGKGGVGKTVTSLQLAAGFARMGLRVLVIDGDLGLANVDVLLGLRVEKTLEDVVYGKASITDIMIEGPLGIRLIPSGSGIAHLADLTASERGVIREQIYKLQESEDFDVAVIDTGAGISAGVVGLNALSQQMLVLTTCDPHAVTDAYAMMKVMQQNDYQGSMHLVPTQVTSEAEGQKVFARLADATARFLGFKPVQSGMVPHDPQLSRAVLGRKVAQILSPSTASGQAWQQMALRLWDSTTEISCENMTHLWSRVLDCAEFQLAAR